MTATGSRRSAWLIYTLVAIVLWGVWGIVSKFADRELKPASTQVISTIGVVVTSLLFLLSPRVKQGTNFLAGGLAAFGVGLTASLGNLALLLSLRNGGEASIVFPLTGLFPLVTIFLAMLVLRERMNWIQGLGIVLALVAIYLFNPPPEAGAGANWWQKIMTQWMAYAIVALVLWGVAAVLQKVATKYISTELSTVLFALAFIPVAIVLSIIYPIEWHTSGKAWGIAILFGALIGIGGLALFAAYRDGKASIVTALYSLYPAITVLLAVPIFHEKIAARTWGAIVLALVAAVMLSYETPAAPTPVVQPAAAGTGAR
ncbi:MAG TPA: EamA family transporter [Tepidisphaeraceae bacterium]|nr:EamA family transporter [Tepidisphaeraceae bacterium]